MWRGRNYSVPCCSRICNRNYFLVDALKMEWNELFCSLLLILACGLVQCQECPNPEDISPCTCKQYPMPSITTCSNINDMDSVYEIFRKSFDVPIIYFVLKNCNIQYLPAVSVAEKKFQTIQYEDSDMTSIFDGQPKPTNHLKEFRIYRTRLLRGIEWKFFSSFTNLIRIDVDGTEVKKIGKDFRDNIGNKIQYLSFNNSKTALLEDGVFDQLTEVTWLQVNYGKIKKIKRNMFPQRNQIWLLGFSGNRIRSLPSDIFDDMPKLQVVGLMDNQITTLAEEVFGNWYRRTEINLNLLDNPMVCGCSAKWFTPRLRFHSISAECTNPPSMRGKLFNYLEPEDFHFCNQEYRGN